MGAWGPGISTRRLLDGRTEEARRKFARRQAEFARMWTTLYEEGR